MGIVDASRVSRSGAPLAACSRRVDQPGSDCIYADALSRNFTRQPNREAVDCAFGRGIVHPLSGGTDPGRARGNIHDRTAGSAVAGRHAAYRFAGAEERARDVHGHDLRKGSCAYGIDSRESASNCGIVDQTLDRPQFALGGFKEPDDIFFTGNVSLNCTGAAASGNNRFRNCAGFGLAG